MSSNTINDKMKWIANESKKIRRSIEETYEALKSACAVTITEACNTFLFYHEANRGNVEYFNEIFNLYIEDISKTSRPDKQNILNDLWVIHNVLNDKWNETDKAVKIIRRKLKIN